MAETVLIIAYSGRALAHAAQRAGYLPLVIDAFGDLDMRATAFASETLPDVMRTGFRAKPLLAAIERLIARAATPPIGIVFGSGLEDKPRLIEVLDRRYRVLGCSAEATRHCNDPGIFFPVLDELGVAHPLTRLTPPDDPAGWISKKIGGSGGRHVRHCSLSERGARRYYQRKIDGERISVSAAVADGIAMDVTRQWCAPYEETPYRYGGAVSIPYDDNRAMLDMVGSVDRLARALDLRGLVSFDFIVSDGTPYLLEINPRPGASLDCIDTIDGARFHVHMAACLKGSLEYWTGTANENQKAAAVLHADRGAITLNDVPWPDWSADRGAPGTYVPLGAPLATVMAEAETSDAAEALARARLAELADLIYRHAIPA